MRRSDAGGQCWETFIIIIYLEKKMSDLSVHIAAIVSSQHSIQFQEKKISSKIIIQLLNCSNTGRKQLPCSTRYWFLHIFVAFFAAPFRFNRSFKERRDFFLSEDAATEIFFLRSFKFTKILYYHNYYRTSAIGRLRLLQTPHIRTANQPPPPPMNLLRYCWNVNDESVCVYLNQRGKKKEERKRKGRKEWTFP